MHENSNTCSNKESEDIKSILEIGQEFARMNKIVLLYYTECRLIKKIQKAQSNRVLAYSIQGPVAPNLKSED